MRRSVLGDDILLECIHVFILRPSISIATLLLPRNHLLLLSVTFTVIKFILIISE